MKVLQLSDIHFAASPTALVHGVNPDERLDAVLGAWRATSEAADLVLLTGDLAEDASPAVYERLAAVIRDLETPCLATPGNHDDPGLVDQHFRTDAVTPLGAWQIVCVDTSRPLQIHGTVDVDLVDRLVDAIDDPVLLVLHHPPRSHSTHEWFTLDGGDRLLSHLAARPQVRGLVAGHTHQAFEQTLDNGLQLFGCPSTLAGIAHHGDRFDIGAAPTGARIIDLSESGELVSTLLHT